MIKDNIAGIRERIAGACVKSGRDPKEIITVAVSKGRPLEQMLEALRCGITDIGENKIQEAVVKYRGLEATGYEPKWHMVGHLQSNKAKEAVRIFDLIHSVDSLGLAEEISYQALKINKVQDILIEVNVSGEVSKFGLKIEEAAVVMGDIAKLENINIRGLMTIAPVVNNPEEARPYFRALRELRDKIDSLRPTSYELRTLSMGMSDDFQVAIEEGANIIRLGRAIFKGEQWLI